MGLRHFFYYGISAFNVVLLLYFLVINAIYTLLMLLSSASTWIHKRRLAYQGLERLRESAVTPPVTIIMPAWNEQDVVVESVRAALHTEYPGFQMFVVDDGSTDETLVRLVEAFELIRLDLIYRSRISTQVVRGFYLNPKIPNLLVIAKEHGGKADALNVGINMCRTPYFCTLDTDCVLERDALLRLIRPILRSPVDTVACGGMVRVLNGCEVDSGRIVKVGLPKSNFERFQVVEYLRSFLLGRTAWDAMGGTVIISGAFAMYHRESVVEAGGFESDTVTEDMDLVIRLHRWSVRTKHKIKMTFISDPACWTECPATLANLGRQRRRWQLGLCQTIWKNSEILFSWRHGPTGLISFPFQLFAETLGALVEVLGYITVPLALLLGAASPILYVLFVCLALVYEGFLSVAAVVLDDLTYHRYPSYRDLITLLLYALLENIGYRQVILYYRVQGIVCFLTGHRKWEKVVHAGNRDRSFTGTPPTAEELRGAA